MRDDARDWLRQLGLSLRRQEPRLVPEPFAEGATPDRQLLRGRASVALVVRPGDSDLELLLIKRATVSGDPWSGHMAFPGGRRDLVDRSGLDTAIRETMEEVGIDLSGEGALLGRLDDVQPRSSGPLSVVVSPYVFLAPAEAPVRLNQEVALAIWVPLSELADPRSATEHLHALESGDTLKFPAIAYQDHVIWGITHRIIARFLEIAHTM